MTVYILIGLAIAVLGTIAFMIVMSIDSAKLGDPVDQYLKKDIKQMRNSVLTISITLLVLSLWSFAGTFVFRGGSGSFLIILGLVFDWGAFLTFKEFKLKDGEYKKRDS